MTHIYCKYRDMNWNPMMWFPHFHQCYIASWSLWCFSVWSFVRTFQCCEKGIASSKYYRPPVKNKSDCLWCLHSLSKFLVLSLYPCSSEVREVFCFWDNPKLLDDGGEIPKSQGRGWCFDSQRDISSLHDKKLARWLIVSCVLALACRSSISKQKRKEKKKKREVWFMSELHYTRMYLILILSTKDPET